MESSHQVRYESWTEFFVYWIVVSYLQRCSRNHVYLSRQPPHHCNVALTALGPQLGAQAERLVEITCIHAYMHTCIHNMLAWLQNTTAAPCRKWSLATTNKAASAHAVHLYPQPTTAPVPRLRPAVPQPALLLPMLQLKLLLLIPARK